MPCPSRGLPSMRTGSSVSLAFLFLSPSPALCGRCFLTTFVSLASQEPPQLFEAFIGVGVQDDSIQCRFLSLSNSDSQIGAA